MLTGVFEHDFSDSVTLRSLARYQKVDQLTSSTPPQGTWCLPAASTAPTGRRPAAALRAGTSTCPAVRAATCATPRNGIVDQPDRPDLALQHRRRRARAGGRRLVLAAKPSTSTPATCCAMPTAPPAVLPRMDISDPDSLYTGPRQPHPLGQTEGTRQPGHLRVRHLEVQRAVAAQPGRALRAQRRRHRDLTRPARSTGRPAAIGTINGARRFRERGRPVLVPRRPGLQAGRGRHHLPVLRQLQDAVEGLGQRRTAPPAELQRRPGNRGQQRTRHQVGPAGQPPGADRRGVPQRSRELQGRRPGQPGQPVREQQLDGEARVDGVVARRRRPDHHDWSVFANYTYLDSEVLQGVSDSAPARCGNTRRPDPSRAIRSPPRRTLGQPLDHLRPRTTGRSATASPTRATTCSRPPANARRHVPGYTTHRAMVALRRSRRLALQLNANNLLDKEYYTRVRNNGWATPGETRSFVADGHVTRSDRPPQAAVQGGPTMLLQIPHVLTAEQVAHCRDRLRRPRGPTAA